MSSPFPVIFFMDQGLWTTGLWPSVNRRPGMRICHTLLGLFTLQFLRSITIVMNVFYYARVTFCSPNVVHGRAALP